MLGASTRVRGDGGDAPRGLDAVQFGHRHITTTSG
jgi:hypothetical protein